MNASVYIETAGCAFNVADGEAMAGVLRRHGFLIARRPADADLVILNTCTVKNRTFSNFRRRLRDFGSGRDSKARIPRVVIAGCVPPAYKQSGLLDQISTLDPDSIDKVGEVVRDTLRGRVVHAQARAPLRDRPGLPTVRRNPVIEILPIARGCMSACAFCQTRVSRGKLYSFSREAILDQARRALDEGVREIWVTGQDTGTWGLDRDDSLPSLLQSILQLRGDFRLRLGMTSPQWVTGRLAEYLAVFEHPKMFRFFHVPLQSGSDSVLRRMKREGTVRDFEALHERYLHRYPDATLLTDLIAGFPGETDREFEATVDLVHRLKLPGINISRFSSRPGTLASRMPQLPSPVIKERSKRLVAAVRCEAAAWHRSRVGSECVILIDQKHEAGGVLGRTDAYRSVMLREEIALGRSVEVCLTEARDFSFEGRRIRALAGTAER